jgi:hypothetical protein
MKRSRILETDQGIQGQLAVEIYDQMQRRLRDKDWIGTKDIVKSGITYGLHSRSAQVPDTWGSNG